MVFKKKEAEICKTISYRMTLITGFTWSKVASVVHSVGASE